MNESKDFFYEVLEFMETAEHRNGVQSMYFKRILLSLAYVILAFCVIIGIVFLLDGSGLLEIGTKLNMYHLIILGILSCIAMLLIFWADYISKNRYKSETRVFKLKFLLAALQSDYLKTEDKKKIILSMLQEMNEREKSSTKSNSLTQLIEDNQLSVAQEWLSERLSDFNTVLAIPGFNKELQNDIERIAEKYNAKLFELKPSKF